MLSRSSQVFASKKKECFKLTKILCSAAKLIQKSSTLSIVILNRRCCLINSIFKQRFQLTFREFFQIRSSLISNRVFFRSKIRASWFSKIDKKIRSALFWPADRLRQNKLHHLWSHDPATHVTSDPEPTEIEKHQTWKRQNKLEPDPKQKKPIKTLFMVRNCWAGAQNAATWTYLIQIDEII